MRTLGAFWLYTLLRAAMFGVLWVVLWLVGIEALLAAIIALAISVPLSWFLLAKPRQAFANRIEEQVNNRRSKAETLDARLAGSANASTRSADPDRPTTPSRRSGGPSMSKSTAAGADDPLPPGVTEAPTRGRDKRR